MSQTSNFVDVHLNDHFVDTFSVENRTVTFNNAFHEVARTEKGILLRQEMPEGVFLNHEHRGDFWIPRNQITIHDDADSPQDDCNALLTSCTISVWALKKRIEEWEKGE